jgi:hypothetical protein
MKQPQNKNAAPCRPANWTPPPTKPAPGNMWHQFNVPLWSQNSFETPTGASFFNFPGADEIILPGTNRELKPRLVKSIVRKDGQVLAYSRHLAMKMYNEYMRKKKNAPIFKLDPNDSGRYMHCCHI